MGRRQNDSAHPPEVRPVDVDGVRTVAIVTVGWGVAFVVLALRQGQLNDSGNGWWLWTCLAGVGLGLLGLEYCRKRRDAIAQSALEEEAESGDFEDDSAVGDWSRLPPEDPDFGVDEQSQFAEPAVPAEGDHLTQPYQHAEQQRPGHSTGDMPVVPGQTGQPVTGYPGTAAHADGPSAHPEYYEPHPPPQPPRVEPPSAEPPEPPRHYEPTPQPPVERPRPQSAPPAPAPQQQPSMPTGAGPSRPAAQRPAPPPRQSEPAQPARLEPEPEPSEPQLEAAPQDPYSTGAEWYDSAAGYTPEADRARRHPRDRRPEAPQPPGPGPAAEPPPTGREHQHRRPLEDSEFFGAESDAPPPNSTAEFLLADLEAADEETPRPAHHDRDAPDDDYRGRRTRRSR